MVPWCIFEDEPYYIPLVSTEDNAVSTTSVSSCLCALARLTKGGVAGDCISEGSVELIESLCFPFDAQILPGVKVVIVNPETKGPVGDSHLGEVCIIFIFTLKSWQ